MENFIFWAVCENYIAENKFGMIEGFLYNFKLHAQRTLTSSSNKIFKKLFLSSLVDFHPLKNINKRSFGPS